MATTDEKRQEANDLLVVGAGYLGQRVAKRWLRMHPNARVVGVTNTDASHETLRAEGIEATTVDDLKSQADAGGRFPYVVFSAPPRSRKGSDPAGYIASVDDAITHWAQPLKDSETGGFVFTSSGGVLSEDNGGTVTEDSAVSDTASAKTLLEAEQHVRTADGTVLRLAGLYDLRRGAHAYWLKTGVIKSGEGGLVNQVHYDDAAEAVVAALRGGAPTRGNVFLVGDGSPMSRLEIVNAARKAPVFKDAAMPSFEPPAGATGGHGKVYDTSRVKRTIGWKPQFPSFAHYMAAQR
eukprot:CAMPEP_0178420848 /NCGR_PEP_ID=MMETSP0689_2-20121128/26344_1 /TAXON_ID=160604 /ORGANISM="Amphidinium massartii, Strain CS-259" /LENGTH=293 /DNA_ID=CAMNT_0020042343 /DNA_START=117 /DNA_END=998 /DNA_ORIENTATION=+